MSTINITAGLGIVLHSDSAESDLGRQLLSGTARAGSLRSGQQRRAFVLERCRHRNPKPPTHPAPARAATSNRNTRDALKVVASVQWGRRNTAAVGKPVR